MDKNSLIAALRKAESEKFASVPSEETVEHAFSDRFQHKMDRLIRAQRLPGWNMLKTPARRSVLLFLILLLTFGVRPDQNPLFRFAQPIPQLTTAVPDVSGPKIQKPTSEDITERPASMTGRAHPHTARAESYLPEELSLSEPRDGLSEPPAALSVSPDSAEQTERTYAASEQSVSYSIPSVSYDRTEPSETVPVYQDEPDITVTTEAWDYQIEVQDQQNERPVYSFTDHFQGPENETVREQVDEVSSGSENDISYEPDLPPGVQLPTVEFHTSPWQDDDQYSYESTYKQQVQSMSQPELPTIRLAPEFDPYTGKLIN